jgi:hypothetical protein
MTPRYTILDTQGKPAGTAAARRWWAIAVGEDAGSVVYRSEIDGISDRPAHERPRTW